jgi:hypothetical protein
MSSAPEYALGAELKSCTNHTTKAVENLGVVGEVAVPLKKTKSAEVEAGPAFA